LAEDIGATTTTTTATTSVAEESSSPMPMSEETQTNPSSSASNQVVDLAKINKSSEEENRVESACNDTSLRDGVVENRPVVSIVEEVR